MRTPARRARGAASSGSTTIQPCLEPVPDGPAAEIPVVQGRQDRVQIARPVSPCRSRRKSSTAAVRTGKARIRSVQFSAGPPQSAALTTATRGRPRCPGLRRCTLRPARIARPAGAAPAASVSVQRVPVAASGWPRAIAPPLTFSFSRSRRELADDAEDLSRERFVDLPEVDVFRRQARARESGAGGREPARGPSARARIPTTAHDDEPAERPGCPSRVARSRRTSRRRPPRRPRSPTRCRR